MLATNLRRGGSGPIDSALVVVGYDSIPNAWGYGPADSSISPDNLFGGSVIGNLVFLNSASQVLFTLLGNIPNSGWSRVDIAGAVFLRADGYYTNDGSYTRWQ